MFRHKIYTGPLLSHDESFLNSIEEYYSDVSAGTSHIYITTKDSAESVIHTISHKLGVCGFTLRDISTTEV
jgi:hypothetical protein